MTNIPTVLRAGLNAMLDRSAPEGEDNRGFNAADENAARTLVNKGMWGQTDFRSARSLMWKYRRQLGVLGFTYNRQTKCWRGRTNEDVTVKVAIVGRTEKALKVFLMTDRKVVWVPASLTRFACEGTQRGRSGEEFQVGALTLPAWKVNEARPVAA